jgi:plasmid stability protein
MMNVEVAVASITIRNFDDALKSRLRVQAAIHGRSMEDEARDILRFSQSRKQSADRSGQRHTVAVRSTRRVRTSGCAARGNARATDLRLMILLDTIILSELIRPTPEPAVERWLAATLVDQFLRQTLKLLQLPNHVAQNWQHAMSLTSKSVEL